MINKTNVLIISSDSELFTRLAQPLRKPDYKVFFASSNEQGLKSLIDQIEPDIIVIDPEVPTFKGIALSMLVRRWSPVPILMLSAACTQKNEIRTLDMDAEGYLSQPFNVKLVPIRIDNVLAPSLIS